MPYWFWGALVLYLVVHAFRRTGQPLPATVNSYLSDLLCMPIVLMICLLVARKVKRNTVLELSAWQVAMVTAEYILLFEVILPAYSVGYTADPVDALLYLIGSCFFFAWQKRSAMRPA